MNETDTSAGRTCDHDDCIPSFVAQGQRFIMCAHCKLKVALPVGDIQLAMFVRGNHRCEAASD